MPVLMIGKIEDSIFIFKKIQYLYLKIKFWLKESSKHSDELNFATRIAHIIILLWKEIIWIF